MLNSQNAGHTNYTIGYEEYINSVHVTLQKIKKVEVSSGVTVLDFPIDYHDEEKNIVTYQKQTDFLA